jgi:histidinol-phosphate aminotransferase
MLAVKHSEPRVGVLEIEPYVTGNNTTPQGATVFKLSSNETPLGPSPDAVRSYEETAEHLAVGSGAALRVLIGRACAVNPALILCGAGSDELLNLLAQAFLGSGDEAIHTVHGFLVFWTATLSAGGRPVVVPECNYPADVDAILSAATSRTKIVVLANPNNPIGNASAGIWPPRCYSSSMPLMPNMCVVATKIRDRAGRKR